MAIAAVLLLLLLILINGVFAMSEIALVSARRGRLEAAAERGGRGAAVALDLQRSPTRFLSTVQIGITLIGILAGAFGEAAISDDLAALLAGVPALERSSGPIATGLVVLAITYFSLVLGELVPKRLALTAPERIASALALPMRWLARLTAPFVHLLTVSTDLLLRLLVRQRPEEHAVTEEDIRAMLAQAAESGAVYRAEQTMVERVFRLGDLRVRSLMVPRPEIEYLRAGDPLEQVRQVIAGATHSHFPVCRGGLDHIVGVVHVRDLIRAGLAAGPVSLERLARPPLFVPEVMPALKLLETFREKRTRIAFVVDEHGVLQGLVTLNDLVQAVIGGVVQAGEPEEPVVVRRPDGSWLIDGALPMHRLVELLGVRLHQAERDYETVGGLVIFHLGHIPRPGETFSLEGLRFEIVDMDRNRVDKVLVSSAPEPPPGERASG